MGWFKNNRSNRFEYTEDAPAAVPAAAPREPATTTYVLSEAEVISVLMGIDQMRRNGDPVARRLHEQATRLVSLTATIN